jgi:hypothetical protein
MKFTVVFPSHESKDHSFGVVFTPSICWVRGGQMVFNPHPLKPHYRKGDLRDFLDQTGTGAEITSELKSVVLVVHPNGHGTDKDLELLGEDLWEMGFEVQVVRH